MVRLKQRYIIGQVLFDPSAKHHDEVTNRSLLSAILEKIAQFYGEVGTAQLGTSLVIKFYDGEGENERPTQLFILRCAREAEQSIRFAMSAIILIKRCPVILRSLSVSGSSRTCITTVEDILSKAVDADLELNDTEKLEKKRRLRHAIQSSFE